MGVVVAVAIAIAVDDVIAVAVDDVITAIGFVAESGAGVDAGADTIPAALATIAAIVKATTGFDFISMFVGTETILGSVCNNRCV